MAFQLISPSEEAEVVFRCRIWICLPDDVEVFDLLDNFIHSRLDILFMSFVEPWLEEECKYFAE